MFQSFCVRNNISRRFIWKIFHFNSKIQLSAFLSVFPLSIFQQNCRHFSEKMKIFNFGQIFFPFMLNENSQLMLLFRHFLVLLPRLCVLIFFMLRHNRYLKKRRKFSKKSENFRILVSFSKLLC